MIFGRLLSVATWSKGQKILDVEILLGALNYFCHCGILVANQWPRLEEYEFYRCERLSPLPTHSTSFLCIISAIFSTISSLFLYPSTMNWHWSFSWWLLLFPCVARFSSSYLGGGLKWLKQEFYNRGVFFCFNLVFMTSTILYLGFFLKLLDFVVDIMSF